jgi:rhodanese-related sulfurtransferase
LIPQLPPQELKAWLDDGARPAPLVLDVREPWEHDVCSIAGSQLIPMQEIPVRVAELPRERDIVVFCHHGMRSLQVAAFLARAGFDKVLNLAGGIAAWAEQVEPSMARY